MSIYIIYPQVLSHRWADPLVQKIRFFLSVHKQNCNNNSCVQSNGCCLANTFLLFVWENAEYGQIHSTLYNKNYLTISRKVVKNKKRNKKCRYLVYIQATCHCISYTYILLTRILKTLYFSVKVSIIGSRDQLCIHEQVKKEQSNTNKVSHKDAVVSVKYAPNTHLSSHCFLTVKSIVLSRCF